MRLAGRVGWLVLLASGSSCALVHEVEGVDGGSADSATLDAGASRDVGIGPSSDGGRDGALTSDAEASDTPLVDVSGAPPDGGPDCSNIGGPVCASGGVSVDHWVALEQTTCGEGEPECVTVDMFGRDAIADPSRICAGPDRMLGSLVVFARCAAGSSFTSIHVTTLDGGTAGGGWFRTGWATCGCEDVGLAPVAGEAVDVTGRERLDVAQDTFRFFGAGAHYRVRACARPATCP